MPIIAYFRDGTEAEYTTDVFFLLVTDPDVVNIVNGITGEVIYSAREVSI